MMDFTMEVSMGKTFELFSTDQLVRRRLQQAHAARNAYIRAAFVRLYARCAALLASRDRPPAHGDDCVPVAARIDLRR
jgi:hypothetical protein